MEPALGTPSRVERVRQFARSHALVALSVTGRLGVVPVAQHRTFLAGFFADCTAPGLPPAGAIGATLLEQRLRT